MLNQTLPQNQEMTPVILVIGELNVNSAVFGWLFAVEVTSRKTNSGKLFLDLRLRDQRGSEVIARYFNPPRLESHLPQEGRVVLLEGVVEEYRGQVQINLMRVQNDDSIPADRFTLGTRCSIAQLEVDFQHLIDKVGDPGLRILLNKCFVTEVMERFRRWPAAVRHHGAVVGGLLEHTVNVSLIAQCLTNLYSCNDELALAGALLHDIGKLKELEEQPGRGFTPAGNMFGHIILGTQYVQQHALHVTEIDEATRLDLLHIILAHHGSKEFGSPVYPATIEALIVHLADMAEAKLTGFLDHCDRTSTPNGWSSYYKEFGGPLRMP